MNSKTITLTVPIWRVPPIPHARKGSCVCDDCWRDYLVWCDGTGKLSRRRRAA